MAFILPFEEEIYRKTGIPHEFVGHPVLDEAGIIQGTQNGGMLPGEVKAGLGLDESKPLLSLLPGSRPSELKMHLPLYSRVLGEVFSREVRIGNSSCRWPPT